MNLSAHLTLFQPLLDKIENLLCHQQWINIVTYYLLTIILNLTTAVAYILRHSFVIHAYANIFLFLENIMQA